MSNEPRHFPNDMAMQGLPQPAHALFLSSLEKFLDEQPPPAKYEEDHLAGLFGGYTGMAYMFLQLSAMHPDLNIKGKSLRQWAEAYIAVDRKDVTIKELVPDNFGVSDEAISFAAVKACLSGSDEDVSQFLAVLTPFLTKRTELKEGETREPFWQEIVFGAAGALYILRAVRHWVPSSASAINKVVNQFTDLLVRAKDDHPEKIWTFASKKYTGAAHGELGNITQIVLTTPSRAAEFKLQLEKLLSLQMENGNFPAEVGRVDGSEYVQYCHGAGGFVFGLQSLRPFYPELHEDIDKAIKRLQSVIWDKGLLKKEPSLCHGIFGNAL